MTHFSQSVDSRYGAPLGRFCGNPDPDAEGRFTLQRVPIDSGGYDRGGAYWGHGAELYYYASADGTAEGYFRLSSKHRSEAALNLRQAGKHKHSGELSREGAKLQLREEFPQATFYR